MSTQPQRQKTAGRRPGAPAVIFVDDLRWDAFTQLAARLRRSGIRTVRVTTERGVITRLASRLLFDRYVHFDSQNGVETLRRVLTEENVIDVQLVETLKDLLSPLLALLEPSVAHSVATRLSIMDKYAASETFSRAGVRTPSVLLANGSRPATVAAQLGMPLVAKMRVGCGGRNVTIVTSLNELEAADSSFAGGNTGRYFEQFIEGIKLNYAATVSDEGIEQELAYRVSKWLMPVGTATEIETIDDQALVAFGRRAVLASSCKGLINLDIIRDAQGVDWLIDFNARAFGGGANFLSVDVDVSDGYLRSLGRSDVAVGRRSPVANAKICIFPASLGEALNEGSYRAVALAFLRQSRPYLKSLGWRYWLSEPLRVLEVAAAMRNRRRAERSTTPDEGAPESRHGHRDEAIVAGPSGEAPMPGVEVAELVR